MKTKTTRKASPATRRATSRKLHRDFKNVVSTLDDGSTLSAALPRKRYQAIAAPGMAVALANRFAGTGVIRTMTAERCQGIDCQGQHFDLPWAEIELTDVRPSPRFVQGANPVATPKAKDELEQLWDGHEYWPHLRELEAHQAHDADGKPIRNTYNICDDSADPAVPGVKIATVTIEPQIGEDGAFSVAGMFAAAPALWRALRELNRADLRYSDQVERFAEVAALLADAAKTNPYDAPDDSGDDGVHAKVAKETHQKLAAAQGIDPLTGKKVDGAR